MSGRGQPFDRFPTDVFSAHAHYNRWMNENIYECAARLTEEERKRDMGAFFRSVHMTLNHLLMADRVWLERFGCPREVWQSLDASGKPIAINGFDDDLYPHFAELRAERRRTDCDIEAFAAGLSQDRLDTDFEYKRANGETYRHPLWWAVTHFFNHQAHHRGQVTTLLKQLRIDPGVTDLVIMLREGW
jgi:uncharacterized damage-inducible protein DinB